MKYRIVSPKKKNNEEEERENSIMVIQAIPFYVGHGLRKIAVLSIRKQSTYRSYQAGKSHDKKHVKASQGIKRK